MLHEQAILVGSDIPGDGLPCWQIRRYGLAQPACHRQHAAPATLGLMQRQSAGNQINAVDT
jgi:hypothetical protein